MANHNGDKNGDTKDALVSLQSGGMEVVGTVVRLGRHAVVFEVYKADLPLRVSEALGEFKIQVRGHAVYSGRAVIRGLVNTGVLQVCEAILTENSWSDAATYPQNGEATNGLRTNFQEFIHGWQQAYRVSPEYKVIVADIHSFLADLRLWLNQVELGIRSSPGTDRAKAEFEIAGQLRDSLIPATNNLFDRFEEVADKIPEELLPAHYAFGRRQLHPLMLCSPFLYRCFTKPMGYAGDYEMINMILRDECEGSSLFAKLVNSYLLDQAPPHAVRNRVGFLLDKISQETGRVSRQGGTASIYNVACGAAREVQRFLAEHPLADRARFDLLDFNEETLQYCSEKITAIKRRFNRNTGVNFIKKSVHHLLKEKDKQTRVNPTYDLIYCSGLYDYLSDRVCKTLNTYLYEYLSPGGLMVIGNFAPSTPRQNLMEHFLEWFLIYRDRTQLMKIAPQQALPENCEVRSEPGGANFFLEVRKPK